VITDRSTAVLAHGLGGSTDLPIPLSYALIGAAWADVHVRCRSARLAAAAVRPRQTGPSAVAAGDDTGRRPGDALGRRDREPVRSPSVTPGARRHRRGIGGAARVDRVRQLLGHPAVARLCRRPHRLGRHGDAAPYRGTAGVRRGRRGRVLARGARDRRCQRTASSRTARPDGALADPDRHRRYVSPTTSRTSSNADSRRSSCGSVSVTSRCTTCCRCIHRC
jgi:hypothetical protein